MPVYLKVLSSYNYNIKAHMITILGYSVYNIQHVINLILPEYIFPLVSYTHGKRLLQEMSVVYFNVDALPGGGGGTCFLVLLK